MERRTDIPPPPARIARLPVGPNGFPVPWFVAWIDGKPEFRVADGAKFKRAVEEKLCWVCGEKMGAYLSFVLGPMCTVNRISAEPPSHHECAVYSARACPFLSKPRMVRREEGLPADARELPGVSIKRNPGVTAIWTVRKFQYFEKDGGILFLVGDPERVEWFAEGRPATRSEVLASVDSGIPLLRGIADKTGPEAHAELDGLIKCAARYYPPELFVPDLGDRPTAG